MPLNRGKDGSFLRYSEGFLHKPGIRDKIPLVSLDQHSIYAAYFLQFAADPAYCHIIPLLELSGILQIQPGTKVVQVSLYEKDEYYGNRPCEYEDKEDKRLQKGICPETKLQKRSEENEKIEKIPH